MRNVLCPDFFLVALFVLQTEKDVTFAAKELDGNQYFNALRDEGLYRCPRYTAFADSPSYRLIAILKPPVV